jgi:hypothetical protein
MVVVSCVVAGCSSARRTVAPADSKAEVITAVLGWLQRSYPDWRKPGHPAIVLDQTVGNLELLLGSFQATGRQLPRAYDLLQELRDANRISHPLPASVAPGPFVFFSATRFGELYSVNPGSDESRPNPQRLKDALGGLPWVVSFSLPVVDERTGHALVVVYSDDLGSRSETELWGLERRGQQWIFTEKFFLMIGGGDMYERSGA